MRSVIVGVDGSEPSVRALVFAADLAEQLREAELVVVYGRYIASLFLPGRVAEDEFADVLDASQKLVHEAIANVVNGRALVWRVKVEDEEPSTLLERVAKASGGDSIVVVGRRGWSAVHELFMGSVSNRLVHQAGCAVLLVD